VNLSECASATSRWRWQDRHRPHPLGDAWRADRDQRASARARARSRSSTTASSRTSANCAKRLLEADGARNAKPIQKRSSPISSPASSTAAVAPIAAEEHAETHLHGALSRSAFLFDGQEDLLIGARKGSPLASRPWRGRDVSRLRRHRARRPSPIAITYLEEGDWVVVTAGGRRDLLPPRASQVERARPCASRHRCTRSKRATPALHGQGDRRTAGSGLAIR
jgi:hypothetical protein